MRVTREQAMENRERVVEMASRLFREHGFDGVGIADVMKAAGLTHGGFYGHFRSKDDLMAEAMEKALIGGTDIWASLESAPTEDTIDALIDRYVSDKHRQNFSGGCGLAALGSDVARKSPTVKQSYERGLRRFTNLLARALPSKNAREQRAAALAMISQMVGALILSRSVNDPALSDEILKTARVALHRQYSH